jgi:hypothetical protein
MNPRLIAALKLTALGVVIVALVMIFPKALEFVETGARELRYFWWEILLVVLAAWLIWGLGRKK